MLDNPLERIKLLRAGVTGKTIEQLYIEGNFFKIVTSPVFIKLIEIDTEANKNIAIHRDDTQLSQEAEQLLG